MQASAQMLERMVRAARQIAQAPDFTFAHYGQLFAWLQREDVLVLFEQILHEIRDSAAASHSPYLDQVHLASEGDFNLTLKIAGRAGERGDHLTASEFDLLVVNLSEDPVSLPVYRTTVDVSALHRRPGPLLGPERLTLEPRGCRTFAAYAEIADLAGADREVPLLVVHSLARGATTWVFSRASGESLQTTDNHLQSSRMRMAARAMGELHGGPDVIDTLEQLARSDYLHFVRWEAAEAVYRLDPARGAALLRDHLAHDAHPSICKAARATLDNMASAPT